MVDLPPLESFKIYVILNTEGQYHLGWMYYYGTGVTQDYDEAVNLFRLAADQGNSVAQCSLGEMYEKGEGVAKDNAQAVDLCRKAAEEGDEDAKALLRRLGA